MGRPVKWRRVSQMPSVSQFWPSGLTDPAAKSNDLLVEELEAIRLKDLEGLEQEECADQMQVSRPTFQRILMTARRKVADSLITGKGIRITGGNFTRNVCLVRCLDCGLTWEDSVESLAKAQADYPCPHCHSTQVVCAMIEPCPRGQRQGRRACAGECRRQGWNRRPDLGEKERATEDADHDSD